jgi:hypothetical protein
VEGQEIPLGELETEPVPTTVCVKVSFGRNVAVTDCAELMVTTQVEADPEHPPPDQLPNVSPAPGVSVSLTTVPEPKVVVQVEGQEIPTGLLTTEPVPDIVCVNV